MIDEEPFRVLYCEDNSSPNTSVNIIIGANIIKELLDLSDDEIVEGLMLDIRLQYALHTTSFREQPLSDKSLTRFRKRCYDYREKTGIDLMNNSLLLHSILTDSLDALVDAEMVALSLLHAQPVRPVTHYDLWDTETLYALCSPEIMPAAKSNLFVKRHLLQNGSHFICHL